KASASTSSTVSPSAMRLRSSSVLAARPASSSCCMSGSSALISATTGCIRFTSRSCLVPKTARRIEEIMIWRPLYRPLPPSPEQGARVLARGGGGGGTAQHPGHLLDPLLRGQGGRRHLRASAADALHHAQVLIGQGCDRRQVGHAQNLTIVGGA